MGLIDRYYIKTRDLRLKEEEAKGFGIRQVYNFTSDIDFMGTDTLKTWADGLYDKSIRETVIIESSFKVINGVPLYVCTCIVFISLEFSNMFYFRCLSNYKRYEGFLHLYN